MQCSIRLHLLGRCNNPFFLPDETFFATPPISVAVYLFDGVAAIALAADAALKAQGAHKEGGEALLKALLRLEFDGASGRVAFDEKGDRDPATIQFALGSLDKQTTNITYIVELDIFDNGTSKINANPRGVPMHWIDGGLQPPDAYRSEVCENLCCPRSLKPQLSNPCMSRSVLFVRNGSCSKKQKDENSARKT